MSLRLAHTKTGKNQWVEVRDAAVRRLMRRLLQVAPAERSALLFPFSAGTFRRHFKAACADLGLAPEYVPHSLRHGGATHDHLTGVSLEEVLRRGRWASMKSARHYVQSGRALLLTTSVPPDVALLARRLAADVVEAFALTQRH